ncbi:B-cell lymphoma/leukemia 11B-like isoform X1 [Dermacentor albipictus]|uniref:B-cell lymphoma/leukemia 11B-like isoform X1 n=1 Tax=Dermacentor albipictus TaxID=60249 RepID=UPI0038FD0AD2
MILPCDVASSHVSSSSSASSSLHPCAVQSLSVPSSVAPIFASMDHHHQQQHQQSPEQLMAQYAAHVLRQHQQQAKPYSRRTPAAKPYSCEQCGRGFKYLHTLRFHIKTTHDSAAPAVEPRLSRLRRDAPPDHLSSPGAYCGAEPPTDDSREEDLSMPRPAEGGPRSETDVPPEFPQDAAPAEPPPVKEEPPESYGPVKSESQDVATTTSCVGSLSHMTANLSSSLAAAGLPSPSSLLGMDAWRSMKLQAEVPLASKVDVVNPLTEQQYTLYKCGICGETQPSLRGLCDHLQAHTRAVKEHHCDKCGAVFKWRSQLLVHEQVHQVIEGKAGLAPPPPAGLPVLSPLPEALIGEPRVSFDQALQLGALAGHFLQPGSLPNIAMGMPLAMPPTTTSVAPTSTSSVPEFTSPHCAAPPQRGPGGSKVGSSCPSSSQEAGMRLPFQCSYCSKSFDRIFSLQRHERIHTGVKPCYCKACGRGFSERRNLRHHIIRFHSDVSQRDQLRRRRRAAAARSRAAAVPAGGGGANGGVAASGAGDPADDNPQGSLKLVSFLKKTAVRILNSVDQSKDEEDDDDLEDIDDLEDKVDGDLDDEDDLRAGDDCGFAENGSPDGFKEDHRMDGSNPELTDEEGASPMASEMPVALCMKDNGSPICSLEADRKADDEEGEEDNKTIIYPLEAMPMATPPVELAQADEKSGGDGPLSSQDLDASNEELRRPATGNRRKKGRPMRYGPAVVETSEDCGSDKGVEEGASEVKEMGSETSEERVAEDEVNPYTKEEMAAWMQLGKAAGSNPASYENGEASSPDPDGKAGTASRGPFLSAYNPRMDMAERPISRDEACTPQMGPDGKFVYPCSYCYKTFSSTSDLNRHMDFHEGIRQFLCRACSYHAVTQSDLSRHEKTRQHLVRQQNACSSCGLGFNSPALLGDHALSCGAVRDLTSKVQSTTEANNNDRSFESRNGESLSARPRPPAEDSAGHSSSGGGSRLEKSCVLLKKKLLCFEGAL